MKILFDQGVPVPLRRGLSEHTIATAYEMGWMELDNGQLIQAAEPEFEVPITTDKNPPYQQSLIGRRLAILILPTTSWPTIQAHEPEVAAAIGALRPGEVTELKFS
jgi:hypothetical protein